ncbi:TB2/DP1, HVA22 family-domain-containing protein [Tribonema minus]|uniref:TB2/DP1, HVA22 family-domain-containing protein n=1 Tax=Tribonema minus TaxID=303371 RepID=A0A836CJQ6_9STRA|nr:TB2/DP1, HVA22 family-domain-containing protein [Tribonema minus]
MVFAFVTEPATAVLVSVWAPYQSFKAIKSSSTADDTAWLTFWAIYALFDLVESFVGNVVSWAPFYWEAKFVFIVYLMFYGGAHKVYTIIEPFMSKYEGDVDSVISKLPAHVRDSAKDMGNKEFVKEAVKDSQGFIKKYGKEAFEGAMKAYTQMTTEESRKMQ